MDEIIIQVLLRCSNKEDKYERLGSTFTQASNFASSFFAQMDVASDFYFWESVKERDDTFDGKEDITRAILAFAILGLILNVWQIGDKIKAVGKKGKEWLTVMTSIVIFEDLPQLILLLIVSKKIGFDKSAIFSFWTGFTSICMKYYEFVKFRRERAAHHGISICEYYRVSDGGVRDRPFIFAILTAFIAFFAIYFTSNNDA